MIAAVLFLLALLALAGGHEGRALLLLLLVLAWLPVANRTGGNRSGR